jgi:signal transduction histidine kinase
VTYSKAQNAPEETTPELGRDDLYGAYWNACVDGLFAVAVTADGKFLCAGLNAALETATGLASPQTRGKEPFEYLEADTASSLMGMYRECLDAGSPITRTKALIFPTGACTCQVSVAPVTGPGGRIELLLGRAQDVSAAQNTLRELSDLTERLLDIQEEERRRIALELHDSTSQHLVAVQLGLTVLSQGRATDQTLADMRDELMEAHREIRTLTYLLHPPRLADERLSGALRQFVDGFQRRTGAAIDLKLTGPIDETPHRVQRAIFRVLQEAMANAHKHASARLISVRIARDAEGLRLEVADDGRNPELLIVPGVGIPGMEARIERFGGTLTVTPSSLGTTVSAFIPAAALELAPEPEPPADAG